MNKNRALKQYLTSPDQLIAAPYCLFKGGCGAEN